MRVNRRAMTADALPTCRLMVSGWLRTELAAEPLEMRRGMAVVDRAGEPVGTVTGVLVDQRTGTVVHLVLGRDIPAGDYRLTPIEQVASLDNGTVRLWLTASAVVKLPRHNSD